MCKGQTDTKPQNVSGNPKRRHFGLIISELTTYLWTKKVVFRFDILTSDEKFNMNYISCIWRQQFDLYFVSTRNWEFEIWRIFGFRWRKNWNFDNDWEIAFWFWRFRKRNSETKIGFMQTNFCGLTQNLTRQQFDN